MKIIIGIIIVIAVAWVGYTILQGPTTTGAIKIGYIGPLTGDAAAYGEPIRNSALLAVEEINKAGGVKGKQIQLVVEDAQCNGKDAANATQKLVNIDKVKVIIGGTCSSETLAAVPIAAAQKVLVFSPAASSPALTNSSPLFVRDYPSDATQGKVLARVAYQDKGWKKVVVIQEQLDYPLGIFNAFKSSFEPLGGSVTKEEFPSGATEFRSIITKAKAQNPDALFVDTQTPAATNRILKQVQELNWKPAIIVNDGTAGDPPTIQANAEILEGALSAEFGVDTTDPKLQKFIAAYKARFNTEAGYLSYSAPSYDAVYLVKEAIEAVGYDGEKVASWIRTVKDWEGISGSITIGSDGDRASGHIAKIIRNGKVELYQK